jgi:hypothetical protein
MSEILQAPNELLDFQQTPAVRKRNWSDQNRNSFLGRYEKYSQKLVLQMLINCTIGIFV